jgi:glycosyltransferase involved in cell wall biosynthesis
MKIGISAFAADGGKSGISQYMINVLQRLTRLDPAVSCIIFVPAAERALFEPATAGSEIVTVPDWMAHPVASILWHLLLYPVLLKRHHCDCAYLPAGNRRLGLWYGVPSVSTIHDLSQLHVEGKYDPLRMFYIRRVLPFMMQKLTRVVSVSESTRRDLVEHAGIRPERIRVAHNGADLSGFAATSRPGARETIARELGIDGPFILYTARLEHPGKNHVRLLEALVLLKERGRLTHRLVLAGSRWNGAEVIEERIGELGLTNDVTLAGFVENRLLPELYAAADVFVFPSLFEGFGIPLLEAMAAGTPVCAASVSSIPEVVGDAALLFDPVNPADIAVQLDRLLQDAALRQDLVARGRRQVQRFSWDDAASGVLRQCHEAVAA